MSRRRTLIASGTLVAAAAAITACGTQDIKLDKSDRQQASVERGAQLFAQRCAGCHTLTAAGAQGSSSKIKDRERVDGPNFDTRKETMDQVLYAIRNGGFSGAIMPQNIVVGREADQVAQFLAKYAGRSARSPLTPTPKTQPAGGKREEKSGTADEPKSQGPGTSQAPGAD